MNSFFIEVAAFSRILLMLFIFRWLRCCSRRARRRPSRGPRSLPRRMCAITLSTEQGRQEALAFCRKMGVTKVYIETFRGGYQADEATLKAARDFFRQAGLEVSGCVTTVQVRQAFERRPLLGLLHQSPDAGAAGVHLPLHRRPV